MKLNVGDMFEITDYEKTKLYRTYCEGAHEVTDVGVVPPEYHEGKEPIPCVFFRMKGDSLEYFARLDCIRKLTKLEKALK